LNDSSLPDETKRAINAAIWHTGFEDLVIRYDLPANIAGAMRKAYFGIKIPDDIKLKTYGDEKYLKDLPVKKYLVSTGYTDFQRSKIDKSGVAPLFDEIIIDEMADPKTRKGKKKIFQEILVANDWDKTEVLAVGDNPNSELGIAKALGITAVQTLRSGVEKWDEADYRINSLSELAGIIDKQAY
jgi:putative hydrolase of the HAD superfamily